MENKLLLGGIGLLLLVAIAGGVYLRGKYSEKEFNKDEINGIILQDRFNNSNRDGVEFEFAHGNHRIEIGDANNSGFTLWAWNDSSMRISLPERLNPYINQDENGTLMINFSEYSAVFYMVNNDTLEFEAVLGRRPQGNKNSITFPIVMNNLSCNFQPPLNQEDYSMFNYTCNESMCWDTNNTIQVTRPDNVINSYACYTNHANNEYQTGKAFHIYRIKAIDNLGNWVWGDINLTENTMTITIPQTFIRDANYPVRIDPSFGYSTIGASLLGLISASLGHIGNATIYNASSGDTITSFSFYGNGSGANRAVGLASYNYTLATGLPNMRLGNQVNITTIGKVPGQWWTTSSVSQSMVGGQIYLVAIGEITGDVNIVYDTGGANNLSQATSHFPATWTSAGTSAFRLSMYANYTTGGGGDCWIYDSSGKMLIIPTNCVYQAGESGI